MDEGPNGRPPTRDANVDMLNDQSDSPDPNAGDDAEAGEDGRETGESRPDAPGEGDESPEPMEYQKDVVRPYSADCPYCGEEHGLNARLRPALTSERARPALVHETRCTNCNAERRVTVRLHRLEDDTLSAVDSRDSLRPPDAPGIGDFTDGGDRED